MSTAANDDRAHGQRATVSVADLQAYVDGGLNAADRAAVEGYLAVNPDLAAKVMTALHMRNGAPAPKPARRRGRGWVEAIAALVICAGSGALGWGAAASREAEGWRENGGGIPPDYVEDAADSRQASILRAAMTSQTETPTLDAAEIRRTMQLRLPALPAEWRVVDVQVYPSDDGPSVNLVLDTPRGHRLILSAIRTKSGPRTPGIAVRENEAVAFWSRDGGAYVLGGPATPDDLLAAAAELSQSREL